MPLRHAGLPRHHARPETLSAAPAMTLLWNAESLWEDLEPLLPGLSIEVVAQAASTNTSLLERARAADDAGGEGLAVVRRSRESAAFGRRAADVQPCLLVAEHQTGGRGRMGRSWASAPGASLTFSLSLPIDRPDWSGLSLAVGVALADALDPASARSGAPRIGLKWPNDLWLIGPQGGRKLGGILIESVLAGPSRLAIVGVGLNIAPLPAGAPAEFTHGHACVQELDATLTAPATLHRIARRLIEALGAFEREGFAPFSERFAARDLLRGQAVTTTQPGLPEGTADGVGPNGALRVRAADGLLHDITSGEVSVRLQGSHGPEVGSSPC